jgi:hypothetical protein
MALNHKGKAQWVKVWAQALDEEEACQKAVEAEAGSEVVVAEVVAFTAVVEILRRSVGVNLVGNS